MVSQLLFGDLCKVIIKKHNAWTRIISEWDELCGWVDSKQIAFVSEKKYRKLKARGAYALDVSSQAVSDRRLVNIVMGSNLPLYDGIVFTMPDNRYRYSGQTLNPDHNQYKIELLRKIAFKYLGSPYMKGGRSPFGIDAGALVQNLYKFFRVFIPRYAFQQVEEGTVVDFVEQAEIGDLAFFENEDGKIDHVGMIVDSDNVLHAYGEVRIDMLDHFGIYNRSLKKYTHTLRVIKRIVHITKEIS